MEKPAHTSASPRGAISRLIEGARRSGPGWLLSAYTLGSGTAITSVLAGARHGYNLLWVNPLAMLIGVIVLSSAAYFALSSDRSPFQRFKTELHPAMAYAWGVGALLASVIWHLPQYAMVYAVVRELGGFEASGVSQLAVGAVVLAISTVLTWQYSKTTGMVIYEAIIKMFVWMTVLCLFILMFRLPVDWGAVGRGLVLFMPYLMTTLSAVGTAAMIWVGGGILAHGLEHFGMGAVQHMIETLARDAAAKAPVATEAVHWLVSAAAAGALGLAVGGVLIVFAHFIAAPAVRAVVGVFRRA